MAALIKPVQKFAVEITDAEGVVTVQEFDTEAEARGAVARVELAGRAEAYCTAKGIEGKNAKGRSNVILDFLAYEAGLVGEGEQTDETDEASNVE